MDKNLRIEQILCLQLSGYSAVEIFGMSQASFHRIYSTHENIKASFTTARCILERQERLGILTLPFYHPDFPENLRMIEADCPPLIHLFGNKNLLTREAVAIIGARQADKRGCGAAYKWGMTYARQGKTVVSGLALGYDAAAHRGCLDAGGNTVAIVATGLDLTYPKENKSLQELILQNDGLLVSEQIIGVKANSSRLVARNRLQAALSREIVVAQFPIQSGTMHTVRFAQKYGKQIYAVRFGQYDMQKSSGNEQLINDGVAIPL